MEFSLSLPSIRRTQSRLRRRQIRLGVALLAPALFLIILIVIYPTARSFVASVTEWDGLHPPEFNGLANFEKLLFKDDLFGLALANSLKLGLISALGSVTIGYMLAELLYTTGATKGVLYRTVYFIPVMLPLAVVGVMFKFIYNPTYGLLNRFLEAVGLSSLTHAWLGEANIVLYSIIAVNIWKTFGLNVVLFFAGLQTIPYELYEAARIDGGVAVAGGAPHLVAHAAPGPRTGARGLIDLWAEDLRPGLRDDDGRAGAGHAHCPHLDMGELLPLQLVWLWLGYRGGVLPRRAGAGAAHALVGQWARDGAE
ncbi:MAG: sugar ABC transporter permease [Anaerolineae bacterium]|nr:sugar ABC transporter permease [Anaerolineae bacterium]